MSRQPQLSPRQADILAFVVNFTAHHGYPPSIRQIGVGVDLRSTSSVVYQLRRLEQMGFLARHTPGAARALTITGNRRR